MNAGLLWTKWLRLALAAKLLLLPMLAFWQASGPAGTDSLARHLRVERVVRVPPGSSGQTCAALDADVYAHSDSASLNDLRLFALASGAETPFTLTESNTERMESDPAAVRNVHMEGSGIAFDLEMPKRPYTSVELLLDAKNFVGSAKVSGHDAKENTVGLGEFAIFDLTAKHLARSTSLALQESSLTQLHVQLFLRAAPGSPDQPFGSAIVQGATVPPSRAAQTVYTAVAGTSAWTQRGQDSVALVRLPARVPVARVRLLLEPGYRANFLRDVSIAARPDRTQGADSADSDVEKWTGQISQVHLDQARSDSVAAVDDRQMTVDAVLAANLRGAATVEVAVRNGSEPPLPLRSVQLEMRERKICFETSPLAGGYTLMYGSSDLPAAVYDYSRGFAAKARPVQATLGPEEPNPDFAPVAEARPFVERHPDWLWLVLLGLLSALGGVAVRGMRNHRGGSR